LGRSRIRKVNRPPSELKRWRVEYRPPLRMQVVLTVRQPRPGRCGWSPAIGAPFGNGSENPPESAGIEGYSARAGREAQSGGLQAKSGVGRRIRFFCHAEGRGFESHQPLR
jgi:hypothetical protein